MNEFLAVETAISWLRFQSYFMYYWQEMLNKLDTAIGRIEEKQQGGEYNCIIISLKSVEENILRELLIYLLSD